jgi:hypothetical protein
MSDKTPFKMQQRIRIIVGKDTISPGCDPSDGSAGVITGMLTISPGYYVVLLERTNTRCIVFETNLEALTTP